MFIYILSIGYSLLNLDNFCPIYWLGFLNYLRWDEQVCQIAQITQQFNINNFGSLYMQIARGIYVDSFRVKKANSIYFLTHWHSDHYSGITTNWNYGPIYCSSTTRKILLTKYPKLADITHGLQLNQTYTLLNPQGIEYNVVIFDSNHIAGSVMILFSLQNGKYVFHTGDMRFNHHCLQSNKELFYFDKEKEEYRCKYQIDTLFLDNTYCDPIFMFPNRSDALELIKKIIDLHHPGSKMIYLVTDTIGKQEAFIALSLHYKVPVTLCEQRMHYAKQMLSENLIDKIFCTQEQGQKRGSWISVIKRGWVEKTLQQNQRAIAIKLTGWANLQGYYPLADRQYIVPYSLHSNYQELELFMSAMRPRNLLPVVRISHNKSNKFRDNIHSFNSYFGSLMHMKQRGFSFFTSHYISLSFTDMKSKSKTKKNQLSKQKQNLDALINNFANTSINKEQNKNQIFDKRQSYQNQMNEDLKQKLQENLSYQQD